MFKGIRNTVIGAAAGLAPLALIGSPAVAATSQDVTGFWQYLNTLQHSTTQCEDLSESTHGTAQTETAVVYGGNCLQAFNVALETPGVAFEYGINTASTGASTVTTSAPATDDPTSNLGGPECVVSIPGPYPTTFSPGPPDANGSCAAYASEYPSPDTITLIQVTASGA